MAAPIPPWEQQLGEYLAEHGLRLTRQRRTIAESFFASEGHPSIEDLHARVRERNPRIGQATVYRTVNLLVDSGLAARLSSSSIRALTTTTSSAPPAAASSSS